jgi:dinuclear metal center YbgI/SA1388 family protein
MPTIGSIIDHLEQFIPLSLAADWDNVGLLLGDRAADVQKVMTCLTVTPESAAEAVESGANLVVTHHPIFFKAANRLTGDTPEGRMLLPLARAGVAVYSPHTAFDNAAGGINDQLAQILDLTDVGPLRRREGPRQVKLVVFVPEKDLAVVSDALFAAGAGKIGAYNECSFRLAGLGTFHGTHATNPTVGQKGRREEIAELRLEVVCPANSVASIVAALRKAHSYEEPAFDLYPLVTLPSPLGEGRVGMLVAPLSLGDLANRTRIALACGPVAIVGEPNRSIHRVAVVCGAGSDFIADATGARADVLLTGEARFHDYLAAKAKGLALVLPGHFATERCGIENLAERMRGWWPEIEVFASTKEADPLHWQGFP